MNTFCVPAAASISHGSDNIDVGAREMTSSHHTLMIKAIYFLFFGATLKWKSFSIMPLPNAHGLFAFANPYSLL